MLGYDVRDGGGGMLVGARGAMLAARRPS